MGDWPRLVNLRRCARALIADGGEDTNTTLALTNTSAAAELLLVWQFSLPQVSEDSTALSYQQIPPFATQATTVPIVPGDAAPPGILSSGDSPIIYTPDWNPVSVSFPFLWPATFPFAVLLPGWSLVVQLAGGGTGEIQAAFWWEAILSKYFDRMHSALCVELELQEDSES